MYGRNPPGSTPSNSITSRRVASETAITWAACRADQVVIAFKYPRFDGLYFSGIAQKNQVVTVTTAGQGHRNGRTFTGKQHVKPAPPGGDGSANCSQAIRTGARSVGNRLLDKQRLSGFARRKSSGSGARPRNPLKHRLGQWPAALSASHRYTCSAPPAGSSR